MAETDETPKKKSKSQPATDAAPAPVKSIEEWATDKGLLPAEFPTVVPRQSFPGQRDPRTGRTVHVVTIAKVRGLRARHNPNHWKFRAAKAHEQTFGRWHTNSQVTEAEFDSVIALVTTGQSQR